MQYRSVLINFELWYTYDDTSVDPYKLTNNTYDSIINDIDSALEKDPSIDSIIGLMLCDGFLYKNTPKFYKMLSNVQEYCYNKGITKLYLIPGICNQVQDILTDKGLHYEILNWDFSVNAMYQSYKGRLNILPNWNPWSEKFLFLGGIPSRANRIKLLSKFYDADMLGRADWSFFKPITSEDATICRSIMQHYSDYDYEEFLRVCERSVDSRYKDSISYSRISGKQWLDDPTIMNKPFLQDPNYISPTVFENTTISIISEGGIDALGAGIDGTPFNSKFLTEKTWRTVINRHPFILADSAERFDFVKSLGLRTFENYLKIPNYAYIDDEDERLDAIVVNTEYFLNNYQSHINEIAQDIEHNFQLFFKIASENYKLTSLLNTVHNVSPQDIARWFEQKSFIHLLRMP